MNINEQWKPVEGFEGLYAVSNLGRVKSLGNDKSRKEKILKPHKVNGYLRVTLCKDWKRKFFLVHRLVAEAFLPNPEGLEQVNHIDENKTNNVVSNLEFCDCKYNNNYGTRNKRVASALSKSVEASKYPDFREICLTFVSTREAGRNGYKFQAVSTCCRGCYSTHRGNFYKGLYWRYAS